jgi:RES domain-containing protein
MLPAAKLGAALAKAKLIAVHGPWSRVVAFRHLLGPPPGMSGPPQPLWGGASRIHGARFTPQSGFDSIYLASDPVTALAEVQAIIFLPNGPAPAQTTPWTVLSVDGVVSQVLNLTDSATLAILETNEQEISGAWWLARHPPTQMLGQAAFDSEKIRGIRYRSAKNIGGGVNLLVFSERIFDAGTDYLEVYDPHGNLKQRLGALKKGIAVCPRNRSGRGGVRSSVSRLPTR